MFPNISENVLRIEISRLSEWQSLANKQIGIWEQSLKKAKISYCEILEHNGSIETISIS